MRSGSQHFGIELNNSADVVRPELGTKFLLFSRLLCKRPSLRDPPRKSGRPVGIVRRTRKPQQHRTSPRRSCLVVGAIQRLGPDQVVRISNLVSFETDKIEVFLKDEKFALDPGQSVGPHSPSILSPSSQSQAGISSQHSWTSRGCWPSRGYFVPTGLLGAGLHLQEVAWVVGMMHRALENGADPPHCAGGVAGVDGNVNLAGTRQRQLHSAFGRLLILWPPCQNLREEAA